MSNIERKMWDLYDKGLLCWKTSNGDMVRVQQMGRAHLSNTISLLERCLWMNNSATWINILKAERERRTGIFRYPMVRLNSLGYAKFRIMRFMQFHPRKKIKGLRIKNKQYIQINPGLICVHDPYNKNKGILVYTRKYDPFRPDKVWPKEKVCV